MLESKIVLKTNEEMSKDCGSQHEGTTAGNILGVCVSTRMNTDWDGHYTLKKKDP